MAWLILFVAGLFEVAWAVGLKYTEGFSRFWPSVGTVAAMAASVALLGIAVKTLPLSTAYAVWTGIGAVGAVILGIVLFQESASAARLLCVGLILVGIVGLKLVSAD
ncbi:MAG: quaternary ammonium compound efflux SMR transporter SugE [Burkholderiaceae bacterium]